MTEPAVTDAPGGPDRTGRTTAAAPEVEAAVPEVPALQMATGPAGVRPAREPADTEAPAHPPADATSIEGAAADTEPGEPGDTQATIATLRAAVLVLSRRMRYRQASEDVSSAEAAVLGRLGGGPKTPGQLAKAEHVRPPSMTRTIERLEQRGYVRREADPQDGRKILVFRTASGDEFAERSRELRTAWLAAQFDRLEEADRQVLQQAAGALRRLSDLP